VVTFEFPHGSNPLGSLSDSGLFITYGCCRRAQRVCRQEPPDCRVVYPAIHVNEANVVEHLVAGKAPPVISATSATSPEKADLIRPTREKLDVCVTYCRSIGSAAGLPRFQISQKAKAETTPIPAMLTRCVTLTPPSLL
jgi:hypothetical protein